LAKRGRTIGVMNKVHTLVPSRIVKICPKDPMDTPKSGPEIKNNSSVRKFAKTIEKTTPIAPPKKLSSP
jgi:hypothetical protein